jgi:ABC-type multidrug transport system permease subunit
MTPKTFVRTLTIMHLAFFGSILGFAIISYVLVKNHLLDFETIDLTFLIILLSLSIFGIVGGTIIKKNVLQTSKSKKSLREKLGIYQTATLIRYATIEGPALFAIVAYIITEQFIFLLIGSALLLYFLSLRPNKSKIATELQLNREHQMEFNRENQELT